MSVEPDPGREAPPRAGALLARAENGDVRAGRRLASVAAALRTAEEDRLDERTRAALGALIESLFGTSRAAIVQTMIARRQERRQDRQSNVTEPSVSVWLDFSDSRAIKQKKLLTNNHKRTKQ